MATKRPLEQARRWWKELADSERYVVSPCESPSLAVSRVLRQEGWFSIQPADTPRSSPQAIRSMIGPSF